MKTNYQALEPGTRENRLGSTICYEGTVRDLECKACQGLIGGQRRCISTASYCTHIVATENLASIENAVVIDHGPLGCAEGLMKWNAYGKQATTVRNLPHRNTKVYSTNLNEQDTIFGAVEKLRETALAAYERHHPDVIFIASSCLSNVIGEDFEGVIRELEADLPIPIGYAGCAGSKSISWSTGFDAEQHATFKALVKPPKKKQPDMVNVMDFYGIRKPLMDSLLGRLGLKTQYINAFATVEQFSHLSEALFTLSICVTLPSYMAGALESEYNVPFIQKFGYGIEGFEDWYRTIAKIAGKEDAAEQYIQKQREIFIPLLEPYKEKFKGKKVMIALGPGMAFQYARVCRELGFTVQHINAFHYDPVFRGKEETNISNLNSEEEDLPITIAQSQHFETIKELRFYNPDLLLTHVHGGSHIAMKLGIPTIEAYDAFGYEAIYNMAQLMDDLMSNTNFQKKLADHSTFYLSKSFNALNNESFIINEGEKI